MTKKQTSSLRRIDNLGRLVLPKEIRQKFHLKQGSTVLVESTDSEILVKNYEKLDDFLDFLKKMVKSFGNEFLVVISSTSKVLANNNKIDEKQFLRDFCFEKETQLQNKSIFGFYAKTAMFFPIVAQGEIFGQFAIFSKNFRQDFEFVRPFLNLLRQMLEDF